MTILSSLSAILAATHGEKPSVVQLRMEDLHPDTAGLILVEALFQLKDPLEAGAIVSVDANRTRVRLLPISGMEDSSA